MASEDQFVVDFVSNVQSYEQGVTALVQAHARLASQFSQTSKAGDRAETQLLGLVGAQRKNVSALEVSSKQTALYNQYLYDQDKALARSNGSIITQRYALYDLATSYGAVSAALLGVSALSLKAAIDFESAFTAVQRTSDSSGASIDAVRDALLDMSTSIPVAFQDLSAIASAGNQLGIAAGDITSFTETVARFSAVTGIAADQTAQSFGLLSNILNVSSSDFENLGSSITLVARTSRSTEQQIISLASRLGSTATRAGFTADQVIGLAGALGSLGVAPERAQGVFEKYFNTLNESVAEGGERLQNFASIVGLTTSEVTNLVQSGQGFEVFQRFISALQGGNTVELTSALQALGLEGLRVNEVIPRIAANIDVLQEAFSNAEQGFSEGTELQRQFGLVVDDVASKITIFQNAVTNLAAAVGQQALPVLGTLLDAATNLVLAFTEFVDSPFGGWVAGIVLSATLLIGALAGVQAISALGRASLLAYQTAVFGVNASQLTAVGTARLFAASLFGVQAGATAATVATRALRFALLSTGVGAGLFAVGFVMEQIAEASKSAEQRFTDFVGNTAGLSDALAADAAGYREAVASGNQQAIDSYTRLTLVTQENKEAFDQQSIVAANAATILGTDVPTAFRDASAAIDGNSAALGDNTLAWLKNQLIQSDAFQQLAANQDFTDFFAASGANFDDVVRIAATQGQGAVAQYFYALTSEYAAGASNFGSISNGIYGEMADNIYDGTSLLTSALGGFQGQIQLLGLQSAFTGRGGIAPAADEGSQALQRFGGSAGGAAKQVRTLLDYASDLGGVIDRAFDIRFASTAAFDEVTTSWMDLNEQIDEYRRKVQELTADRAIQSYFLSVAEAYGDTLRAGELRSNIADIDADLADATAGASTELQGNSKAAITNRKRITDLAKSYGDYIEALAAGGADQATLNAAVAQSRIDFQAQAVALGYSNAQLLPYIANFNDMATAIARVPRNITVTANPDPALQALNEFMAKARSIGGGGVDIPLNVNPGRSGALYNLEAEISRLRDTLARLTPGSPAYKGASDRYIDLSYRLKTGQYADGGYTGNGGKYEPKGVVHGGEFVMTKKAVNNAGVGRMYSMMRAFETGRGYAMGGYVPTSVPSSGGSGVMGLSPQDRGILRGILDAVQTIEPGYLPDEMISRAAQNGNKTRRSRGEIS